MVESKEYNVYIDESGDEGIRRGSKYFILTAILVEKRKDLEVAKIVDKIKENLEINIKTQLHWNTIKGYPNKLMIVQNIGNANITIINMSLILIKLILLIQMKYIIIFLDIYMKEYAGLLEIKMLLLILILVVVGKT